MTAKSWLAEKELWVGVGARDALEARLIEQAGFDFVFASSLAISASFAIPDASLISMNQFVAAARGMREAVSIPVVVDGDTGYGNAINVIYAVRQYEQAGCAGLTLEDKQHPKSNSLLPGGRQELAPIEEFAGKVRAAVETRRSREFVIAGRVEALVAGAGQEEAMRRASRYAECGADCILIHSSASSPDEIVEFVRRWDRPVPLVLVPTTYPALTEKEIRKLGGKVKMVIYANQPLRAAVKAQEEALAEMRRAGGIHTLGDRIVTMKRIFDLQGVPRMKDDEKRYL